MLNLPCDSTSDKGELQVAAKCFSFESSLPSAVHWPVPTPIDNRGTMKGFQFIPM